MKKIVMIATIILSITSYAGSRIQLPINFEIYNKSKYNIKIEVMQKQSALQEEGVLEKYLPSFLSNQDALVTLAKTNDKQPLWPQGYFDNALPVGKKPFFISIVILSTGKRYGEKFDYQINPCTVLGCATQIFLTFDPEDSQERPALRPQTGKLGGYPQLLGLAGTTESGKKITNNIEQLNIKSTKIR